MAESLPSTSAELYALLDEFSKLECDLRFQGKLDEAAIVSELFWGIRNVAHRTQIVEDLTSPDPQVKIYALEKAEREKRADALDAFSAPHLNDERAILVDNHGKVMKY